jgi:GAF domain
MRNPFVAVDAGTDLRARARELRRSWESTMGGGAGDGVRPLIERSWRRLTDAGLDPDHLHPRRAFDTEALEDMRATSPLSQVIDILRGCLGRFADDAEHVMVVVDATGRILWIEGDHRVRARADAITFREGMEWTERSAGTNAIGTALEIEHAVQVFSAEHFLAEQHPWWCSAAPIHDPASGELVGIVDLSGPMRTAHPHSLALVMAAAGMAEEALALRRTAEDERLRRAFLERSVADRSAVVAGDGRVLLARPGAWLGESVPPPSAGRVVLPDGHEAEAEPIEGGWILRASGALRPPRPGVPELALQLLGHGGAAARIGGAEEIPLGGRAAELVAVLALHPEGLTGEQLTLHLYGEEGNPVSARAEMTRLRRLLGRCVAARPYRLAAAVRADFLEVERLLGAGDLAGALDAYSGPLLPESTAPRVVQAREELADALARAAQGGSAACLWRWLQLEQGREDLAAMRAFLDAVERTDPRHAVIAARLGSLQRRWDLAG